MLPFTRDQFCAVFADYNLGVWPAQIVACLIGLGVVAALLVRPSRLSDRLIGGALAAMWSWTGIAYHLRYFASINSAASATTISRYDPCSSLRLLGDRMRHYDGGGKPKRDFESRRLNGNRLEEFR